jgi:hypothetical protein
MKKNLISWIWPHEKVNFDLLTLSQAHNYCIKIGRLSCTEQKLQIFIFYYFCIPTSGKYKLPPAGDWRPDRVPPSTPFLWGRPATWTLSHWNLLAVQVFVVWSCTILHEIGLASLRSPRNRMNQNNRRNEGELDSLKHIKSIFNTFNILLPNSRLGGLDKKNLLSTLKKSTFWKCWY